MIIRYIVFILAFLCFTNLQGQSTKKPNVVLIIIDDLNDFPEGFYGHPQAKTPHMKALGFSGTRFKHAYSNNPMCGPSRASMFTGVYPHNASHFWMKSWLDNEVLANTRPLWRNLKMMVTM